MPRLQRADLAWVKAAAERMVLEWDLPRDQAYKRARDEVEKYFKRQRVNRAQLAAVEREARRAKKIAEIGREKQRRAWFRERPKHAAWVQRFVRKHKLSTRAKNTLLGLPYGTEYSVAGLQAFGRKRLLQIENCGPRTVAEIGRALGMEW